MAPRGFGNSHARQLGRDRLGTMERWAREVGDVVELRFGPFRGYFVSHPDHVGEVLVSEHRSFRRNYVVRYSVRTFGKSMFVSSGAPHVRRRRLAQPAFHRSRIGGYVDAMTAAATRELDTWADGETRDTHSDMMRLTFDVVGRTLFGADVHDEASAFGSSMDVLLHNFTERMDLGLPYPDWVPTPSNVRLWRALNVIDDVIAATVAETRARGGGDHLLAMLLESEDPEHGRLTDREIRDEAVAFFLAGHETTALALTYTLYLLSQHPEIASRLRDEVDAVLRGRTPTLEDVPELVFTGHVLHEALRLYPPAYAFAREATEAVEVGGYRIPKRSTVIVSQWVTHRDPRWWEQPELFDPDRWADDPLDHVPKFAYFPFGGGPHRCIGEQFAWTEATVVLAMIVQRFVLEHDPEHTVDLEPLVTLRPRYGMRMSVLDRGSREEVRAGPEAAKAR
jgi:cytochrome P450